MADSDPDARRSQLRDDFHAQTARIPFAELQRYFAAGRLIVVGPGLDLIDVAIELALDNREQFETWMQDNEIAGVADEQARDWLEVERQLWAVVADPWVLVQER